MAYSDEAVEGAKKISANISLKALKRIVQYLADIGIETERQTLKESENYIDTYFRIALDSRIMYDTWQEIYDDELLVFIHTEFTGKTEEKLSELTEHQVMKAFLFGYLAGVKDMDGLPESINNILAPGKKKGAAAVNAELLTEKLLNDHVTIRFLKAICNSEGVDIQAAADIAHEEIKNAIEKRNSDDLFFSFLETDIPDDSCDIGYECASQGYNAGYCDAFSDALQILAKYQSRISKTEKGRSVERGQNNI